jgi:hypothetical protein
MTRPSGFWGTAGQITPAHPSPLQPLPLRSPVAEQRGAMPLARGNPRSLTGYGHHFQRFRPVPPAQNGKNKSKGFRSLFTQSVVTVITRERKKQRSRARALYLQPDLRKQARPKARTPAPGRPVPGRTYQHPGRRHPGQARPLGPRRPLRTNSAVPEPGSAESSR